ncbi:MAG: hypothetical protein KA436_01500 [Oligoflexales bacterium]|nr:hypothetical protein [Oligoflexales bacterium]
MIKEVTGDILLSKAAAIAHGVAPNDDFKQGLALSLRENWPSMYKDFRHHYHTSHPKPGSIWSWKGPASPMIVNLFTQDPAPDHNTHPGKASLAHVNHSLHALKNELLEKRLTTLALTKLATGVGGLKWEDVKPLIDKVFSGTDLTVYVYSLYKKGVAAEEV